MAKLLVIGSANVDLVVNTDRLPLPGETMLGGEFSVHLGGKGANQAVAARRAGADVAMLARVGNDAHGQQLVSGLVSEGIDASGVAVTNSPSGVALIITTSAHSNMIVVAPGANDQLDAGEVEGAPFGDVVGVMAQLETPLDGVIRAAELARAAGAWFMLDPAPACPLPDSLLAQVDWLTPNESEARLLLGLPDGPVDGIDTALRLRGRGARGVVVKLGDRGVVLSYGDNAPVAVPAIRVEATDTTAAGDVFNGVFAASLASGLAPEDAARRAVAASALSVTRLGAQTSIPFDHEVDAMLRALPVGI